LTARRAAAIAVALAQHGQGNQERTVPTMTKPGEDGRRQGPAQTGGKGHEEHDAGAYIGHEPEFESETIPGGIGPKDERVSAVDTQPGGAGEIKWERAGDTPEGHRQGTPVSDDELRETP
jgi:hypothetical protein